MLTELSRSIGFLMHDVARRTRYRFDARARSLGITRAQWRVLLILARIESPSQSELADLLDVERITLCRMVDRLADAGLVERRADPSDRRIWRLYLTDKAKPLVDTLSAIATDLEQQTLEPLTAAEGATLINLLRRIHDRMREIDDSSTPGGAQIMKSKVSR